MSGSREAPFGWKVGAVALAEVPKNLLNCCVTSARRVDRYRLVGNHDNRRVGRQAQKARLPRKLVIPVTDSDDESLRLVRSKKKFAIRKYFWAAPLSHLQAVEIQSTLVDLNVRGHAIQRA